MIPKTKPRASLADRGGPWRMGGVARAAALLLPGIVCAGGLAAGSPPAGTYYYSTAEAPRDYRGPRPSLELAMNALSPASPVGPGQGAGPGPGEIDHAVVRTEGPAAPAAKPATSVAPAGESPPRVASTTGRVMPPSAPAEPAKPPASVADAAPDPIAMARQAIAACQTRYSQVQDYVCTFYKRERINGHLTQLHIMAMKARSRPSSVYFKFQQPNKGREAIYVAGRNGSKVVAHDVGLGKLVAGTMHLDPRGSMAMEDNRHPVTEAGIGALIETVAHHWSRELSPEESRLLFHQNVRVGTHVCTMIESIHPRKRPDFMFYTVKLYIDQEHGLPIRFEAYDWPKHAGAAPELVEEYTYLNLRTNVGLRDLDFDPANPRYAYGRF